MARRMGRAFRDELRERFEHGWNTLGDDMHTAGLGCVVGDFVSSDRLPETREYMTANGMEAIFNWARLMAACGAPGLLQVAAGDLQQAGQDTYAEINSGCYVRFDIYVAWGQMV